MQDASPHEAYLGSLFDVHGRSALVTGAASGLGLAISEGLAAAGATVTLADIDEAHLTESVDRLSADGHRVRGVRVDVTDPSTIDAAVASILADVGRLDVAFANAGISGGPGPDSAQAGQLTNFDWERWNPVVQANLTGVIATMRAAATPMKQQRRGRIIVTASTAAIEADTSVSYVYVATKAAVGNIVRQAALELGRHGVLVNGICPGTFRTNIAGGFVKIPENEQAFARRVPLGRIASPDEIKGLAIYLASNASSFVNGALIVIDGGETAGWFSGEPFSNVGQS